MKTICVIESLDDFNALKKTEWFRSKDTVYYCSCSETAVLLAEAGITHTLLKEDLFSQEWDDINQWAKKASLHWFNEPDFSKALTVNGLNVGNIFNRLISHVLIYRIKKKLLAELLLSHTTFGRILIFEQRVQNGFRWKREEGTINCILDSKFRLGAKVVVIIPSYKKKRRRAWLKEMVRTLIGFFYGLIFSVKGKPVYAGMGMLKPLFPLLNHLNRSEGVVFIDEGFHFDAYRVCEKNAFGYTLTNTLTSWRENLGVCLAIFKLRSRIVRLKDSIDKSDWFVFKGRRLEYISEDILAVLTANIFQRLRQQAVCRSLLQKWNTRVFILHEDVDAFRTAALSARQQRTPIIVLSHGIPPTPNDWSEAASNIGVADLIVNSEFEKDKYRMTGYSPDLIHVLGLPRYDLIYERVKRKAPHASDEKVVLYCPHMLTRITKQKKGYLGIHTPGGVTRQNSIEVMRACQEVGSNLLVKPHANSEDLHLWEELIKQYGGEKTKLVSHRSDIFELLANCDLVIATFSTVVIEAMLFDKNVITINFTGRPDLHPYAEKGIAYGIYDPKLLAEAIRKCLYDPNTIEELLENRLREKEYFGGHFDGQNTERVAAFIQSLSTSNLSLNKETVVREKVTAI